MAKVRLFWIGLGSLRVAIIMVALLAFVAIFYEPAYAIINRIVGSNVVAGDGLILGTDGMDTVHVLTDWTMRINNDSTGIDTTNLWTLMAMGRVESTWIADGGIGAADLQNNAVGNAQCEQIDSTWITTGSIGTQSVKDGGIFSVDIADQTIVKADVDTTSTFVFGAAYHKTSATDDSMFMSKAYVDAASGGDASKADVHDSLWTFDQFWGGAELAVRTGVVDEIGIQYPLANDSNGYFVRHTHIGTTADEADTVVFAGYLPMDIDGDGVDSIVYNMKTSHVSDSVYVQIKVYKRTWGIGTLVFCDSVAATATAGGAWEHKTTGALAVAAYAGEFIEIWFIVTFPSQTINVVLADHDKPKVWYTGR